MTLVNITVQNDNPGNTKLSGVGVFIYTTGAAFVTSNTTDVNGLAVFNLPDASYDCLFFLSGFSVVQPQRIVVNHLLSSNNFLITGHLRIMPESLDSTLCRVSGSIYGIDGKPVSNMDVR